MIPTSLVTKDANDILEIEFESFEFAWTKTEIEKSIALNWNLALRHPATKKIVAYLFYMIDSEGGLEITNLGVAQAYRRQGLASRLVRTLAEKFNKIYATVRETNLPAQLFFKKLGLKCTNTMAGLYAECDDAAYFFINQGAAK